MKMLEGYLERRESIGCLLMLGLCTTQLLVEGLVMTMGSIRSGGETGRDTTSGMRVLGFMLKYIANFYSLYSLLEYLRKRNLESATNGTTTSRLY